MKWLKKSPLTWLIIITSIIFTVIAWEGSQSAYAGYKINRVKNPMLAVVFQGLQDGKLPFGLEQFTDESLTEHDKDIQQVQGKAVSGNQILVGADGSLSMNAMVPQTVSENSVNATEAKSKKYEYQLVTQDYFDDAVFIGDSRTDGLAKYSSLTNATFYAKQSLTVYNYFDKRFIPVEGQKEKLTLDEALQLRKFGKVYIMLGINEIGVGTAQSFGAEYLKVLTRIRELQPDAILFVEGIMRVTAEKSATDPVYNNAKINERNALISTIDNHHDVFYLEMNDAVCDENGDLNEEYTFDDVHLKASYYGLWTDYLLQHGIVQE